MAEDVLILYVDDEWENRAVFEKSFAKSFRIKCVANGADALEVLKSEPVAVVVADQRMPGMSGNELLERVKTAWPDVMRVIVTAYGDLDPILRAVNEGLVHRYIVKPWVRADLETILAWAVEAYILGKEQSNLQIRLLSAERLITIGSIASAVFHDMGGALNGTLQDVRRLEQHTEAANALVELLRTQAAQVPDPQRAKLLELAEELPSLAKDLREGVERIAGLSTSMRRLLKPAPEDDSRVVANPATVIEFVVRVFRQMASSHLKIVYDGPEKLPPLKIGSTELYQVFINLVSNAVQSFPYSPKPGSRVSILATEDGDRLRFVVKDSGEGMPPEVLKSAGILFYTTKKEGAGLGLANCKRIIEGRRGELVLASTPGEGTTATFTLPKAS